MDGRPVWSGDSRGPKAHTVLDGVPYPDPIMARGFDAAFAKLLRLLVNTKQEAKVIWRKLHRMYRTHYTRWTL